MQGYVTYVPWRGDINNVRLHFESVVAIAHLTDRYIAIPNDLHRHTYEHVAPFRSLHPAMFFDLSTLPIVRLSDVSPGRSMYEMRAFEPDSAIIALEDAPDIDAFACGRRNLYLPASADIIKLPPLLSPFYTQVFSTPERRSQAVRFVRDHFRHYAGIADLAKHVAASLGEFHAVQVRRTDFIQYHPAPSIETIMAQLADVVPHGAKLVIATDEPNRRFFDPLSARYKVIFGMDAIKQTAAPDWPHYQLSAVEQNLCALAETFTGTRFSTFSAYIHRLRGYHHTGDTRIRFTDGIHHRIRDTEGWPQFSWQPACRHREALWGREFHEGWSL